MSGLGSTALNSAAISAIMINEVGSNTATADSLSVPNGGVSAGWTIGWDQEDFHTNSTTAQATLVSALVANGGYTSSTASTIAADVTAAGTNATVTSFDGYSVQTIDSALRTSAAGASILSSSEANLESGLNYLSNSVINSPDLESSVTSALNDPTYGPLLKTMLADYNNQYGLSTTGSSNPLWTLLTSGSATFTSNTVNLDSTSPATVVQSVMSAILDTKWVSAGYGGQATNRLATDVAQTVAYEESQGIAVISGGFVISSAYGTATISATSSGATYTGSWSSGSFSGSATSAGYSGSQITNFANGTSLLETYTNSGPIIDDLEYYSIPNGGGTITTTTAYLDPTLSGGSDNVYTSDTTIDFPDDTNGTVTGGGNTVDATGGGDSVGVYSASGTASNTIDTTDGSIYLNSDTTTTITGGGGDTVTQTGLDDVCYLSAISGAYSETFAGSGGYLGIIAPYGMSATTAENNGTISVSAGGSSTTIDDYGNDNDITITGGYIGLNETGITGFVSGSGNYLSTTCTGDDLNLYGGGNTISFAGSNTVSVYGSSNVADMSSGTIDLGSGSSDTINGSVDTIDAANGDSVGVAGSNDWVGLTSGSATLGDSVSGATSVTISGNNDSAYSTYAGDTVGFSGTGESATLSSGTVDLDSGSSGVTVSGNDDSAYSSYAGNTLGFSGTGDFANLSSGTVDLDSGSSGVTVTGNDDSAYSSYAGNTLGFSGTGDFANLSSGTVDLDSGSSGVTVTGNDDSAYSSYTGDTLGFSGTGDSAALSDATLYLDSNSANVTVSGDSDSAYSSYSGDTLGFSGTSDFAGISSGTVYLDSGSTQVTMEGNGDVADSTYSGSLLGVDGTSDTANIGDGTIDAGTDTSFDVTAGGDTIGLGIRSDNSVSVNSSLSETVFADNETIDGTSGDTLYVHGSNDTIDDSHGTVYDYGSNDVVDGSNDSYYGYGSDDTSSGSDDHDDVGSGGTGYGYGYGYGGGYGLVAGIAKSSVDVVAKFDSAHGNTGAATTAGHALDVADQAISASASPLTTAAPTAFENGQWEKGATITWSFADGASNQSSSISGSIQSQYQTAIEDAFQTWAQASGLTIEEVPDSASTDIVLGWGTFDTSSSGVIGYTSYSSTQGTLQAGVTVELENPDDDALTSNSDGSFTYSGTDVSLYQAALHEIGHALGLGASADANSIMFPELGSSNAGLDATDIADIQLLYGSPADGSGAIASLAQAVASFNTSSAC